MSTATATLPIRVPSVGESITSGVLGSWKRKNGDSVASGDPLFEIETDKVTSEVLPRRMAPSKSSFRRAPR